MHSDGPISSRTIQNRRRLVVEQELEHDAAVRERVEVEPAVDPPHQHLGVELVVVGVAELPLRAPLAEPEHDRVQVLAGRREEVLAVDPLDDPGQLELLEPLAEQRTGEPRVAPGQLVEPGGAAQQVPDDQHRPALAQHLDGSADGAVLAVAALAHWHRVLPFVAPADPTDHEAGARRRSSRCHGSPAICTRSGSPGRARSSQDTHTEERE